MSIGNINSDYFHPHHFIDINCTGNELILSDCPHNGLTHYSCDSWHDAAIACFNGNVVLSLLNLYDILQTMKFNMLTVLMVK